MVDGSVKRRLARYEESRAELILGEGRLTAARAVAVKPGQGSTRHLTANPLFLNLGTHATIPDIPGLAPTRPMTHIEAFELDRIPGHLIILVGGYVGLEFAQAMRRFGGMVTVIERGPQFLSREDQEVGEAMLELFRVRSPLTSPLMTLSSFATI